MLFGRRNLCLIEVERESMRVAGRFNAQVMDHLRQFIQPGITTGEIDQLVLEYTRDHGHTPACLGYQGFPKSCCTSINEVICHGIPGNAVLEDGDIVNLDVTTVVDGWLGDQSETFLIGNVSEQARRLVQCAFDSLYLAIDAIGPGDPIVNIGRAISRKAHVLGYEVVREYVGHGIGKRFHQEPSIPHFPNQQSRFQKIDPGVCFTIEPMINEGVRDTVLDRDDGWTVRTRDGKLSAQFEHTILMTDEGPEILTLTETGPQCGHQF
ncbi:MAG: type I methionyl aminopeptidase [Planctomycetaceae bacterium]|jgi:methionyl aminopeptidase|nr:type I methionyl aminopeptidase [Planctomycetaceae bacterium]MBP62093.1 type I methionyl aminopeptidase [Planctomycetaceae bacterium]